MMTTTLRPIGVSKFLQKYCRHWFGFVKANPGRYEFCRLCSLSREQAGKVKATKRVMLKCPRCNHLNTLVVNGELKPLKFNTNYEPGMTLDVNWQKAQCAECGFVIKNK